MVMSYEFVTIVVGNKKTNWNYLKKELKNLFPIPIWENCLNYSYEGKTIIRATTFKILESSLIMVSENIVKKLFKYGCEIILIKIRQINTIKRVN